MNITKNVLVVGLLVTTGYFCLSIAEWFSEQTQLGMDLDRHGNLIHAIGGKLFVILTAIALSEAIDRFVFPFIKLKRIIFDANGMKGVPAHVRQGIVHGYFNYRAAIIIAFALIKV